MSKSRRGRPLSGHGTYVGRVIVRCPKHGNHDWTVESADDDAWEIARWLGRIFRGWGIEDVRVLVGTRPGLYRPGLEGLDVAPLPDDDMPF